MLYFLTRFKTFYIRAFLLIVSVNIADGVSYGEVTSNVCKVMPKYRVIKILSIKGGGVKGIATARVLQEIESKLDNKSIAKSFDIITGTSTGGIIALLLSVPDKKGGTKYKTDDIVKIYAELSGVVFKTTFLEKLLTLNGLIRPKYSAKTLKNLMTEYFDNTKLSDSKNNLLIPAYDIRNDKPEIFTTYEAHDNSEKDYYMKDVAMATSAAPAYFPPVKIGKNYFIDGGLILNNPVVAAYVYSMILHKDEKIGYFILTIGTENKNIKKLSNFGKLGWVKRVIEITIDGVATLNDKQAELIIQELKKKSKDTFYYFKKIPIKIEDKHEAIDNSSRKNLEELITKANKTLEDESRDIQDIICILNKKQ